MQNHLVTKGSEKLALLADQEIAIIKKLEKAEQAEDKYKISAYMYALNQTKKGFQRICSSF